MTEAVWRLDEVDGVHLLRCAAIASSPGIAHAFSTRIAFGRANFDLGSIDREDAETGERRTAFLSAAGLGRAQPALLRQVHGGVIVDAASALRQAPAADGVIRVASRAAGVPVPAVRTADCVAVLVVDRHAAACAALHAGWRGVAAGIGTRAVMRFEAEGVAAARLVVAMGPAILGCCFEVGDDVVSALGAVCGTPAAYVARSPSGRTTVDLHAAMRAQLVAAGIPAGSVYAAPWCTRCRNDLFFSFRGEGPAAGRLMAAIGPAQGP